MAEGVIHSIKAAGYGFVRLRGTQTYAFFHATDLADGLEFGAHLKQLDVEFQLSDSPKGLRAWNVRPRSD